MLALLKRPLCTPCPAGVPCGGSARAVSPDGTPPANANPAAACRSFYRCFTIHATSNLLVQNNVAFDSTGHCFYLEVRWVLELDAGQGEGAGVGGGGGWQLCACRAGSMPTQQANPALPFPFPIQNLHCGFCCCT